jgi:hypothetical protein
MSGKHTIKPILKQKPLIFRQVPFSLWKQILTEEAYADLEKWMYGQTCGVSDDGQEGCPYPWDIERWIRQGCRVEQNVEDWD